MKMNINKTLYYYFLILFSIIPISIISGSSISLFNILLIDISFIILMISIGNYSFLKNDAIKYLLILYFYLIFNSIISTDLSSGVYRNLGFIRIIILFLAFNFFFNYKNFLKHVLLVWTIILSLILVDIFWESYFGKNILGYGGVLYGKRLVSFFKDEPIIGGFVNSFYLLIIGFLYNNYSSYHKNKFFLISLVFLIAIFLTGERSNSIRALMGLTFFYFFLKEYNFKQRIIFLFFIIIMMGTLVLNSQFLKLRYVDQIHSNIAQNKVYFKLYKSGFEVFKNNKFFGVGNKNYRVETCKNNYTTKEKEIYHCSTHPHQIYFEMLAEHGLFGTFLIFFIFYKLIFSKIIKIFKENNYIQLGTFIYLALVFLPLIPSGAFFNDYSITIFGINLSIFYASNKHFNIFSKQFR